MTRYTEPPWKNNRITHHPNKGLNPKLYQYIISLLNTFAAYKFIQHGMNYKGLVLKLKLQLFKSDMWLLPMLLCTYMGLATQNLTYSIDIFFLVQTWEGSWPSHMFSDHSWCGDRFLSVLRLLWFQPSLNNYRCLLICGRKVQVHEVGSHCLGWVGFPSPGCRKLCNIPPKRSLHNLSILDREKKHKQEKKCFSKFFKISFTLSREKRSLHFGEQKGHIRRRFLSNSCIKKPQKRKNWYTGL